MKKLIVFELDGTLAEQGKEIEPHIIYALKELENSGKLVALCSGKPAFYLTGLLRQIGLKNQIIIGENGAEVQIGNALPPNKFTFIDIPEEKLERMQVIKKQIAKMFNNEIWIQNNRFAISPFPKQTKSFKKIEKYLEQNKNQLKGLKVYRHADCFDIVAEEVNKKEGLLKALEFLNLKASEMVAVGDAENDYPMFELAEVSIGINLKDKEKVNINVNSIEESLDYIKQNFVLTKSMRGILWKI